VTAAVAEAAELLEAERLVPVPRAHRVAAVDVDDLALILHAVDTRVDWVRMSADVAAAYGRLELAVRRHR